MTSNSDDAMAVQPIAPSSISPETTVSVIVGTRNRYEQLSVALRSILASRYRSFDLIVVDQSDGTEAEQLVKTLATEDHRVRIIRDPGRGAARARNIGVAASNGHIIVCTDDDCEVTEGWLGLMVEALEKDAMAGMAFGSVVPAPHDPSEGYIDGYVPPRRQRLTGRLAKLRDGGIGASMAFRREAIEATGPLDELLGPGSYFTACEDGDIAYRVLKAGFAIWHVPDAVVIHHGLRTWQVGGRQTRQTYVAIAAAYIKHLRQGDMVAALLLLQQMWFASVNVLAALIRLNRPFGFGRLLALNVGIWRSFELDAHAASGLYKMKGARPRQISHEARSKVDGKE